ncbi:hypothetical protein E2C01_058399 [Portunus trituberculatus]|uniref:Uncharacterized protein n=1 Tax=Portunus trituberculatus TaxID=210409 RepID=A0A5B7H326_PORTR|nr:hypothetical protein [Portunus trituberculatus]
MQAIHLTKMRLPARTTAKPRCLPVESPARYLSSHARVECPLPWSTSPPSLIPARSIHTRFLITPLLRHPAAAAVIAVVVFVVANDGGRLTFLPSISDKTHKRSLLTFPVMEVRRGVAGEGQAVGDRLAGKT